MFFLFTFAIRFTYPPRNVIHTVSSLSTVYAIVRVGHTQHKYDQEESGQVQLIKLY